MRKIKKDISLKQAVDFHGHLGPYLVLGLLAGEFALKNLKCKKYFGLNIKVWGAAEKPKSCLIDGLQLSTGATYGKGNIEKLSGQQIEIEFVNRENQKKLFLTLKKEIAQELGKLESHRDSEAYAKKLYRVTDYAKIFYYELTTKQEIDTHGAIRP